MIEKPYIILIGAFERDNFGDILFPKIYHRVFTDYSFIHVGLLYRDMRDIGGEIVYSIKDLDLLIDTFRPIAIICCGGEIIPCDLFSGVMMCVDQFYSEKLSNISHDLKEMLVSNLVTNKSKLAYMIPERYSNNIIKNYQIIYNSIGATTFNKTNHLYYEVMRNFSISDYISVRDDLSYSNLEELKNNVLNKSPDIVSLLPMFYDNDIADTVNNSQIIDFGRDYFVFQFNQFYYNKYGVENISNAIFGLVREYNLKCILQPAGIAAYHDTFQSMECIKNLIDKEKKGLVAINYDRNIWSLVNTIKNATFYLGTSLHGFIISSSFGVLAVSLENDKARSYINTWYNVEGIINESIFLLPDNINKVKDNKDKINLLSKKVIDDVLKNIYLMKALIDKNISKNKINYVNQNDFLINRLINHNQSLELAFLKSIIELESIRGELESIRGELESARDELVKIFSSRSWKLTKPLRFFERMLKKIWHFLLFGRK